MIAKPSFFLLFLISIAFNSYSADITLIFPDGIKKPLRITKPLDGKHFPGTLVIHETDGKNRHILKNDLASPGLLQIYYDKLYTFYIAPGRNYTIGLTQNDTKQSFSFDGQDKQAQYWLNRLSHPAYQSKASSYMSKDSTLNGIQNLINNDIAKEHGELEDMRKAKMITLAFYQYGLQEIDYYYGSVLAQIIFDSQSKPEFVATWEKLFTRLSPNADSPLATMSFYDYADQYASWYKTSYFRKIAGTTKRFNINKSNEYLVDLYHRYADNLTGSSKEYMLANFLYTFSSAKKYEPELIALYNEFDQLYPNSVYKQYIRTNIDAIIAYHSQAKETTGIVFLNEYHNLNNVQELLVKLGDGITYIDMWATWCKPCKEEFAYAEELHKFLRNKNVRVLYLSFDVEARDTEWKKMMEHFKLTGLNMRATEKLRQDLVDKIWKSKSYTIPRYLIVKNGIIVNGDALRPSDKQKLYDQLNMYL